MKIKSRSHITDTSGKVLFVLAAALLESGRPCVFPLVSRKQTPSQACGGSSQRTCGLFALFIFWDDGFAQSPVAVTAGLQSQAHHKGAEKRSWHL